ncbi:hypothetical protein CYY_001749 [Polysphondylium violaceum]|uniref:Cytochrome c oxidase subunit IV n=1 Tax=Polysphondylium violaceum TaxID=133409 RepID=A0A8J4PZC5_9MYCE|nr:hypothetical protein CYY_001749 [Polysphondylium violaceum]
MTEHKLRYPKGFTAYPHSFHAVQGHGLPKGYVTLAGVGATLLVAGLYFGYAQATKRDFPTRSKEWKAATAAYQKEIQADPIFQLPKQN